MIVKKYRNRRLYDTGESRYVTLDEVAQQIRGGEDLHVVDAKSGADLTQSTLAQIILESRGGAALLPAPVLLRLVRLGDDALAEFMGRYVTWALDIYLALRRGAHAVAPVSPLASLPFSATDALARLWASVPGMGQAPPPPTPTAAPDPEPEDEPEDEIAALRRELSEIRQEIAAAKDLAGLCSATFRA